MSKLLYNLKFTGRSDRGITEEIPKGKKNADGMHTRVLRELANLISEPLSIIFERPWRTGVVSEDWRKASLTPVFEQGKKEDPGNYRSVNSIPGKMMEQLILQVIIKQVED